MPVLRSRSRPAEVPAVPGYLLEAPVGFGAGGAVWGARDLAGRPVAVAFVRLPPGERGTATLRRLGALRSTAHPHLPKVLDVVGVDPGRCALVSEIVEGPTLATVRSARGDLGPGAAATLLGALAAALAHLHDHGVVHGDVAPTNVVLTAAGVPVLVDLAADVAHERGTPGFVAPERRRGAPASTAADVWALARVVGWASGETRAAEVLAAALSPDPDLRPAARDLARSAVSLSPPGEIELPSGADLAQARLRSGQAATELAPPRRPRGRHRRSRRVPGARGALALAALGVGVTLAVTGGTPASPASLRPAEASTVVRGLVGARDEALRRGETEALARLTVPGSPAAREDEALVEQLRSAGLRPEDLRTTVEDVVLVEATGGTGPGAVVDVVLRQGEYRLMPAGGAQAVGLPVAARDPRCVRLVLAGPAPWRLEETAGCPPAQG
ncbi:protein kinase [Georgenia sp. EYE_87]|uniref:protein kinase domain-containing protein n=1 Tax=Georgenia sp. EYE_87 TaxID=2853448 RepID=UPI0020052C8F|nr:protein kinase [Georgenia sp. EYE_87]MCK6209358.1 protein kinase [Georgenia sp. EYE_87]